MDDGYCRVVLKISGRYATAAPSDRQNQSRIRRDLDDGHFSNNFGAFFKLECSETASTMLEHNHGVYSINFLNTWAVLKLDFDA